MTLGARVTREEAIPDAELTQANEQLGQDYADLITSSRAFIDEARDDLRADIATDESADEDA